MVFDIAAAVALILCAVLELAENLHGRLTQDIGQHIQTAAMRHTQHDFAHAVFRRLVQRPGQQRQQRFGAFQGEALGAAEHALQKNLELFGISEFGQDAKLSVAR